MSDDLWGELPAPDSSVTPTTILKEQAAILTSKSNGLLEGEVSMGKDDALEVVANFSIVVPAMNRYRWSLLQLPYKRLTPYPFKAKWFKESGLGQETIESESDFKSYLRGVFQSEEVQKTIAALLREVGKDG